MIPPAGVGAAVPVLCRYCLKKALRRHPMHNIVGMKDPMLERSAL